MIIHIKGSRAVMVYDERLDISKLGTMTIKRASFVEPGADNNWTADLSPVSGPILGPFGIRSTALTAERLWLEQHI